jgi:hypothetical protein
MSENTPRKARIARYRKSIPPRTPPDHVGILLAAVTMMVIGWGGLLVLITASPPRIGSELWLFFMLFHIAITGTVLPLVRYLNVRFTPLHVEPPPGGIIVRQSVWIGLFMVICSWLQMLRTLTLPTALFLSLVFIVLEIFLRSREGVADE